MTTQNNNTPEDDLELTFTSLRLSQLQFKTKGTKLATAGSCNHSISIPLRDVLCLFKGEKITNPELIRFSYQVKMFQVMQNLVDEESLCLPPLYTRILAQWKKLGLTPGELKPSLPAVVPSVQFLGKPGFYDFSAGSCYYTNRRLVSVDGTSWRHTGVFGIDVDLKENPEHTAESLLDVARAKLPGLDGFLFAYVSPNRGLKIFFQVSHQNLQQLNQMPQLEGEEGEELDVKRLANERAFLHNVVYYKLADYVAKETGFVLDMACKDPARMQFLYLGTFIPGTQGTPGFHVSNIAEVKEAYLRDAKNRPVNSELPSVAPGSPKPKILVDFIRWLKVNEYHDTAQGLEQMDYVKGDGCLYGECPQCRGGRSEVSTNLDLRFYPHPQYANRSYFYCFHASCHGANPDVVSVQWLFNQYLADIEAEVEKNLNVEVWCQDPLLMKCFMQGLSPINSNASIPNVSSAKLRRLDYPYVKQSKTGKLIPLLTDRNIGHLLHYGLNIRVFRRMNTQELLLLDFKNCRWYETNPAILSQISGFWQEVVPGQAIPAQRLMDALRNLAQSNYYHPLATFASSRPWDAQDRLRNFLDFFVMDQTVEMPEGWTPDSYRDAVLTTWLIYLWKRVAMRLDLNPTGTVNQGFPQNYVPVFSGKQGVGKTKATEWLFNGLSIDKAQSIEGSNSADSTVQMSRHSVIVLDEIDEEVSNKAKQSKLKRILTGESDNCRIAYGSAPSTYHYCASVIGSTNQSQFLRDNSGSRRYYPLILGERPKPKEPLPEGVDVNWDAVKKLFEMDNQQLWAQIKYMVDSGEADKYSWSKLVKVGEYVASNYASCQGDDTDLVKYLVPVALKDTDVSGGRLSKKIPGNFTTMRNVLEYVRVTWGNGSRQEGWDDKNFERDLAQAYGRDSLMKHSVRRECDPGPVQRYFFLPIDLWMKEASRETKERIYAQYPHIEKLSQTSLES